MLLMALLRLFVSVAMQDIFTTQNYVQGKQTLSMLSLDMPLVLYCFLHFLQHLLVVVVSREIPYLQLCETLEFLCMIPKMVASSISGLRCWRV